MRHAISARDTSSPDHLSGGVCLSTSRIANLAPVEPAVLYIVALPIGNPGDVTLRALRILEGVSAIAAEDRLHAEAFLRPLGISTEIASYRPRAHQDLAEPWIARLQRGEAIALVSDAGTPCIADPGMSLVEAAIAANMRVTAAPGPNAALAALVLSGLPTGQFTFVGFPPRSRNDRREFFNPLAQEPRTLVIYETRSHLLSTLRDLQNTLGIERKIALNFDLTRSGERIWRGTIGSVTGQLPGHLPRGEYVIVLHGSQSV